MDIILLKLLTAHFAGDFLAQPDSWVAEKEALKLRSPKLYWHVAIHAALMLLLTIGSGWYWQIALISISHLIIDGVKLSFQKASTKRTWFLLDQVAHLLVICLVWLVTTEAAINLDFWDNARFWTLALGALIVTWPAGVLIKIAVARWTRQLKSSLTNGGKFIGIAERLLIFVFIVQGHWEPVGFLLAAKSVFRFGELKDDSDIKRTEYILIGTLLSFGLAIVISLFVADR